MKERGKCDFSSSVITSFVTGGCDFFFYLIFSFNNEDFMFLKVHASTKAILSQLQLCLRKKIGRGNL